MKRVNLIILVLLAVAFLIIVERNLLNLSDILHLENPDAGMILPFESEVSPDLRLETVRKGEEIPVLITAAEERLGAVVAAMNSVYQNSKANVVFTIVTLNDTVDHLNEWLTKTRLKNVKYKIVIFKPELLKGKISKDPQTLEAVKPLTFARYYLPAYLPEAGKLSIWMMILLYKGTFRSFMKVTSNQDTQLHFLMTVIQHLLRVSFEGLEIRIAI
ncbi:Glycosyltransferase 8 domain-containing protein 1 [Dissostichus eleginoides]|nr:Glycosyltransferase 8 domain-containing protein 1 [Dissostichus eleginoides]